MRKLLIILGVPIDDLNMDEALARIEGFVVDGRATGKTHQIATVNADFVVNALHDVELRRILQESDMATADGTPLVWGARMLGVPLEGRVTGADMVPALAERAAKNGYSIYFFGARQGVAARAAAILKERYPDLKVAGIASPPVSPVHEMDPQYLDAIRAAQPDILLVAFGNPKQEKWIHMYAGELAVPVCIGVGGTLDMIAGVTRRAPRWMQQTGLEWFYRLIQEPRRLWKRYVLDMFYFGSFFLRQWWAMRGQPPPAPLLPITDTLLVANTAILTVRGRLDAGNQAMFVKRASQALAASSHLIVDLAEATFLDSSALGTLVALANRVRAAGGRLALAAVPQAIAQVLSLVRLDGFFEICPSVEAALASQSSQSQADVASLQEREGWSVLRAPRAFDRTSAPALVDTCRERIERNPRLVLDFSETAFLSSAGMAAIVKLNRIAQANGGELRVAGCSRDVLRSLQMVKLDTTVPLYQDVHTAIVA